MASLEMSSAVKNENPRYWQLRYQREDETLSDGEASEYEGFISKLDDMNIKRLEAFAILVERWGKP